jgi:hypothetical protein
MSGVFRIGAGAQRGRGEIDAGGRKRQYSRVMKPVRTKKSRRAREEKGKGKKMDFRKSARYRKLIAMIDEANAADPRIVEHEGGKTAFESLYSERMLEVLGQLYPEAGELMHIAARAQHIRRRDIARSDYEEGRKGYNMWRAAMRRHHAAIIGEMMERAGYDGDEISLVQGWVQKKHLKRDADSQALENVVDVVFLKYYLEDFARKYSHYDDEKMIDILARTLRKMSPRGHGAALEIDYPEPLARLVREAARREGLA